MNKMKKILFLISLMSFSLSSAAQTVEMANNFRGEGKIYVVVAVVMLVLLGIFFYLFRMDRRITKLEREQNSES